MAEKKTKKQSEGMLSKLGDIRKSNDKDSTIKGVTSNTNKSVKDNTINNTTNSTIKGVKSNTTNNTISNKANITLNKKDNKYSDYRENLYLNEKIKKKLDTVSKKTGHSKSEIARMAFEYFFDNLKIK